MKKFFKSTWAFFLILIIIVPLVASCVQSNTDNVTRLKSIELKDYQGEKLSSITDLRENSIHGPQYIDINQYHLEVTGLVENPGEFTYDQVLNGFNKYEKVVRLRCVEGWDVTILWEGFLVRDIIKASTPLAGANTVIFYAYDGYTTSLPLDYFMNNDIMMAYKMNGIVLPPERGYPFQLVAESKWGYKWGKWITKIELSDNPDYKGYWEQGGYSKSGDLNQDFLEK